MDDNDLGRAMPMVLQQRSAVVSATATSAMARQGGNPSPPLPPPPTEKKQRKKWTMEETQMLVSGCNKVRLLSSLFVSYHPYPSSSFTSIILFLILPYHSI